jgi:Icc-related predicted phosphoesterase
MHGECTEIGGMHLAAVGGSNPTIFDTPFELSEENLYSMLRPISKNGMILMTHAPAHGRLDTIPSGLNVGSTGIRRIVDEFSPVLALSGHIHEAIGAVRFGDTLFVNPGPARDGRSALVTLDGGAASAELLGPLSR